MATPLKNFFDRSLVQRIADMVCEAFPAFDRAGFVRTAGAGLPKLELAARARHIASAMRTYLPHDFEEAARIIERSLGPRPPASDGGMASFLYMPHTEFVAAYGADHRDSSLRLLRALTRRFTAEFAIRGFIEREPQALLRTLRKWATDPDPHVRRLVSEGTRLRLPWAPRLRVFQKDPRPIVELLELLKDDPDLFVRRSVANNLNDIGKDHPDLLVETCRRWQKGASPERQWLIKHALRSAVKRADPATLTLLGHGAAPAVRVIDVEITPAKARIGGAVAIACTVRSTSSKRQELLIDLRVHYVKAGSSTSPKVFKLTVVTLMPGHEIVVRRKLSLRQMTTRRHYPGRHRVELLINGSAIDIGSFQIQ